jgi:outer membrane protein
MNRFTGLILVLMLCVVSVSFGQEEEKPGYISKGQWMLGGTMSLSSSTDFIKTPSFSISPMAGYFIGKRWALGVNLGYSISDVTYVDLAGAERSQTLSRLSATPFARYYFGVGKFAPFAEGGYGMNWYFVDGNNSGDNSSYKIGAGLNYFVTPSLAVEGKLLYSRSTNDAASINPISLGIGLQFFLSRNQNVTAKEVDQTFLAKGSWMIGGNINVSLSDNKYSDNLYQDHRFSPMAGYFLTDKLAMGLTMFYTYNGIYDSHVEALTAAPFVRYYFGTKRFAPFAEAAFGGGVTKVGYFDGTEQQNLRNEHFSYGVAAGFNYFITNNVALETKLSYLKNNNFDEGSLGLQAGISFFLSRKK